MQMYKVKPLRLSVTYMCETLWLHAMCLQKAKLWKVGYQ